MNLASNDFNRVGYFQMLRKCVANFADYGTKKTLSWETGFHSIQCTRELLNNSRRLILYSYEYFQINDVLFNCFFSRRRGIALKHTSFTKKHNNTTTVKHLFNDHYCD